MRLRVLYRPNDDLRALWLLVALVLCAGGYVVQTHYQTAIARTHQRTEDLYARTMRDMRIVRNAVKLREVERRVHADLAQVSQQGSLSGTTADFLATLQRSGESFSTRVLAVEPDAAPPNADEEKTALAGGLTATGVTIRVNGRFRDVLGFIEDLSHHSTLIKVNDTELSVAEQDPANRIEPQLDATIHVTMYRLVGRPRKKERIASAG